MGCRKQAALNVIKKPSQRQSLPSQYLDPNNQIEVKNSGEDLEEQPQPIPLVDKETRGVQT